MRFRYRFHALYWLLMAGQQAAGYRAVMQRRGQQATPTLYGSTVYHSFFVLY